MWSDFEGFTVLKRLNEVYIRKLLGVLHDLRKSVLEDERKARPHVSIRPSNLQNERVRRVLRWIDL